MESLLPVINELQLVFKNVGMEEVELPQIVVVGSQSCGKSSVLESLVRKSFLPRGTGIVTRCPIIIQLNQIQEGEDEWSEFVSESDPGCENGDDTIKRYTDYDELQAAIEAKTNEVAGTNKGITNTPIVVRIFAPNVVSLTVVDLPGMVKNPVGDQPRNIETQVMRMIKHYISNPNAIILAVSAGNVDLATSESLKIAKELDPNGERTLAVVTKLDLLDKGVTAEKELEGRVIPVKLGIIGVINRSQQDLNNNKSVEDALNDEIGKLEEQYPLLAGRIGSVYLAKRLNELLLDHIQKCLPDLKARISQLTDEQHQLLNTYGAELPETKFEKMQLMTEVIRNFEKDFEHSVEQRTSLQEKLNDRSVGSKIAMIIVDYCNKMDAINGLDGLEHGDIENMIKQTTNWERFVSIEEVFKALAKKQILLLESPCQKLCVQMHETLLAAFKLCLKDGRVPKLNSEISAVMRNLLQESLVTMKDVINAMFEEHLIMIFSRDDKFNDLLKYPARALEDNGNGSNASLLGGFGTTVPNTTAARDLVAFPMSTEEGGVNYQQLTYIQKLVQTYFGCVQRNIMDYLPKRVMYIMYRQTMNKFHVNVVKSASVRVDQLMVEPENIVIARKRCLLLIKSLDSATEIVNRIQDTCLD